MAPRPSLPATRIRLALVACSFVVASVVLAATTRPTRAQPSGANVLGRAVVRTSTCCGGAARLDDEGCDRVRAYEGPIEARAGRRSVGPVVGEAMARRGRFELSLPPGTYCLVGGDKLGGGGARGGRAGAVAHADAACLAEHRRTCDAVVTVRPGATARARISIAEPCFGVCYRGSMPP